MLGVFLAQEVPVSLPDRIDSLDEDELSVSTCHIGNKETMRAIIS